MQLILFGPPGCGKGTQALLLSKRLNLKHLGTGDLLRDAYAQKTETGMEAHTYTQKGELVPDELVNQLVSDLFETNQRPDRFVMDGYPRTVDQAVFFDKLLSKHQLPLRGVIHLNVPEEEVIRRLAKRWTCPNEQCKATFHEENHPPRTKGICDHCGHTLIKRSDDNERTVRYRIGVYRKATHELIPYYKEKGILLGVCGEGDVESVYERIMQTIPPSVG